MRIRFISLMLAVSIVASCGFKLRGSLDISQDISPIYFQQNSVFELGREIKQLLATNEISVVENVDEVDDDKFKAKLTLLNEVRDRRVLSVDANGRAREYLLKYMINYTIKLKGLKETEESISLTRSLLFDPVAVLAVTNESDVLYHDMQRDAARLVLLKLQALSLNSTASNAIPDKTESPIQQ